MQSRAANSNRSKNGIYYILPKTELKDLDKELNELNNDLFKINKSEDKEMVKYNGKISKIQEKLNFFLNYDLELSLMSLKIGVKEEVKDQLFYTIQDSYYVDVEFSNINGECPTLKHILQKDKYWPCVCSELVIKLY